MQLSMKCSVAVHCLIFIHEYHGSAKVTSNLLSLSTGINPVVIRNILSGLKKAGIISVPRGTGCAGRRRRSACIKSTMRWNRMVCHPLSAFIPAETVPARWPRASAMY